MKWFAQSSPRKQYQSIKNTKSSKRVRQPITPVCQTHCAVCPKRMPPDCVWGSQVVFQSPLDPPCARRISDSSSWAKASTSTHLKVRLRCTRSTALTVQ